VRAVSGREFTRILERHGWTPLRIHGSHHYFGKPGVDIKLAVPVHGNRSLKPGLLRALMRAAGLTEADLS
jgi:predicted RNA binding protein YcfA (HicA-like mRNA interferase family)